jgi:phospholipid-binding lipoprotein MlaA
MMRRSSFALLPALASVLIATAVRAAPSNDDPDERLNRVGFAIYESLDRGLIRPAALAYQHAVPGPVRRGIEHVIINLHEPVVATNDLLQGRFRKARAAFIRFAINSTGGVLGVFDVAEKLGVPHHENGFALTLGRAGVRPGPYLFIPVVGPSTVRDAIGDGIDTLMDPLQWLIPARLATVFFTRSLVSGLDQRASADIGLRALLADATDPYATLRSVYLQNQQAKIEDRPPGATPVLPAFDDDSAPAALPSPAIQPSAYMWVDGQLADARPDTGGFSVTETGVSVDPKFAPGSVGAAMLPGPAFAAAAYAVPAAARTTTAPQAGQSAPLSGQATLDISDWLHGVSVTGGYRYTWDDKAFTQNRFQPGGIVASPFPPGFMVVPSCALAGFPGLNPAACVEHLSTQSSHYNYDVSVNWQATSNRLLYVAGRGYKAGGFNFASLDPAFVGYAPETVTAAADEPGGL